MQINLRQARRLENNIKAAQAKISAPFSNVHRSLSVSIHQNFDSVVQEQQEKMIQALDESDALGFIRFALRKAIESKNELAGVNALMNEESRLKEQIKNLQTGQGFFVDANNIAVAKARHSSLKNSGPMQTQFGKPVDSVDLESSLTEETSKIFEARAKVIQKRINKIVEEIGALNTTVLIELSDADVALLDKHDIIV